VVSLLCVTLLEAAALKTAGLLSLRLATCSQLQLRALRRLRRAHLGLSHKLLLCALFLLIFAPVITRSLCLTWGGFSLAGEVCYINRAGLPAANATANASMSVVLNGSRLVPNGTGGYPQ